MPLIESFIRNPVKVAVGVLLVALFGIVALVRMPMQLTPEVQTPIITVETRWPGASPHEIEREIVLEQEEQLRSVEGIRKLTSECMDSIGRITMEFSVGTDIREALLLVNSRLEQVREYPEDADEPVIRTASAADRPIAWFMFSVRHPTQEQLAAFQKKYPHLAQVVEAARRTTNPGLCLLRLRRAASQHPEVRQLIPEGDVTKLRRFAEEVIETELERVQGVADSQVIGGLEDELQVVVDPQRLAARSLTIADLRTALRQENENVSAGDFWEGKRRYVVRTLGQFQSPEDVASQLIAMRDAAPVYVRDVAEVRLGYKKPDGLVRRYGAAGISINASRETGANVLEVMKGLRRACQKINQQYLVRRNLELVQVYDETDYIYSAIGLVNQNIVVGGLLTVAVLLVFLRSGRSTLVIGLAIPTSIVGTFLMLQLLDRSLNVVSLAGLAFAVGMLVDNAIVVLENIYRHYQLGKPRFLAAVVGTQEVWGAVAASTLTTLAVFLPVLFIQEEAGQLFRDIALAISSAVGLSLIVSVTLIPTSAARLLPHRDEDSPLSQRDVASGRPDANGDGREATSRSADRTAKNPPAIARDAAQPPHGSMRWIHAPARALGHSLDAVGIRFVQLVVALNRLVLHNSWRRAATVCVLTCTAVALTAVLWPKVEYLPTGNRNLVFGIFMPPPGYNLNELMVLGEQIEAELKPYWDVYEDEWAEHRDIPIIADFFYVARGRQVFLGLRAADPARARDLIPLVQKVTAKLPGTFAVVKQSSLFEQGLSAGRTIDVEITGPDLTRLVDIGRRIHSRVVEVLPKTQARPVPSLDLSSPEVHVVPDRVRARDLGIMAAELGYTVDALVDGAYAADYFLGGDKIDLTILGAENQADRSQDLAVLPIATSDGRLVTLSSVARVELASGPEQINRRERERAITIEVSPPVEVPLEDAVQTIQTHVIQPLRDEGVLSGQYHVNLSGTADKLRETWHALRGNILLALLITYLLMAALFESWLYPLVIIVSVPLGAVGGVTGLNLLSTYLVLIGQPPQTLDVLTMLGFVILIGTVVNNAILIVHHTLVLMRQGPVTPLDAVLDSVRTRIRPIFMTTLTTVLGLAPLVFFPGSGSELYRGLGSVVLGGLMVSTIFTLILVPALFSLTMDAKRWLLAYLRGEPESDEHTAMPARIRDHALPASPR